MLTNEQQIKYLIDFLNSTKDGLIKPFDPSQYLSKLANTDFPVEEQLKCCPDSVNVRDAKDFKPYIIAACDKLSELLNLKVKKYER